MKLSTTHVYLLWTLYKKVVPNVLLLAYVNATSQLII